MKTKKIIVTLLALGAYFSINAQIWTAGTTGSYNISPISTKIGIGTTDPKAALHILSSNYLGSSIILDRTDGWGASFIMRNAGTSPVLSGRHLGSYYFQGTADVTNGIVTMNSGAAILSYTTQAWSKTASGTKLEFATTANNSTTPVTRLTIDQDGSLSQVGGKVFFGTKATPSIVLINTSIQDGTSALTVNGRIAATEVEVKNIAADFVFDENYKLSSLQDLEKFINANKHLPGIAPANETVKGVNLGEFNQSLLQKVEELTLYLIAQQKEIESLKTLIISNK